MSVQNREPQETSNQPRTPAPKNSPSPKEAAVQPSGPRGDNPSTAGPGQTAVRSNTPENNPGRLNPSAPEDVNITPGSDSTK